MLRQCRREVSRLVRAGRTHYDGSVKMARQRVTKSPLRQHADDNFVPGSVEERLLMVWPITREIAALNRDLDVERRLQRHVVRVARRGR